MTQVTDPALLAQLNGPTKVTDPSILAQLNGAEAPAPGLGDKLKTRLVNEVAGPARDPNYGFLDTMKNLGGAAGDVESSVASAVTPGVVKKYGKEAVDAAADTKAGRAIGSAAQSVSKFEDEHPSIGKPVRAVGSVLGATAGAEGLASGASAANMGKDAVVSGARKAATAASDFHAADSALARGYKSRTPEMLKKSTDTMKAESSATFKAARAAGDIVPPHVGEPLVADLEKSLIEQHGKIDPDLHSGTRGVLDSMAEKAKKGMDLEDVDNFRSRLREIAEGGGKDADKAGAAIDMIDKKIASTKGSETWNKARDQWAKAKKFETISDIVRKSDGDINKAKKALRDLAGDPKKNWAFNEQERAAIKQAGEFGTAESLLNFAGKFGFDVSSHGVRGSLGGTIGSIATLGAHSAGVLPVVGTVAKSAQNLLGRSKIEDLLQHIEHGPKTADQAIGAVKDPLAIAAPNEFRTTAQGVTARQTDAEANKAIKLRQRDTELGITPGVRRAISEKLNNAAYHDLSVRQQEMLAQQIQKAYDQGKAPIEEIMAQARDFAQSVADAKGEKFPDGPMSDIYSAKRGR